MDSDFQKTLNAEREARQKELIELIALLPIPQNAVKVTFNIGIDYDDGASGGMAFTLVRSKVDPDT